ncbi:50S ribosomal protein L6 [Clostridia bacterium]|nr:50S ribosomal protein L6 [Clostridia bacterium]
MSRIGKLPVAIPAGVTVDLTEDNTITVKGPKGELSRKLVPDMNIAVENGNITVTRPNDLKRSKSLHGLTRSLINNMVEGVTKGYVKQLEIVGTGWRAAKNGGKLTLSLGYSHPVEMTDPDGVTSTCDSQTKITIAGIDKEKVGQYAAEIRSKRPPEPYNGKGVKYAGEQIIRKAGKTGKK